MKKKQSKDSPGQNVFPFTAHCEPITPPPKPRLPKERRLGFTFWTLQRALEEFPDRNDKIAIAHVAMILSIQQYNDITKRP